MDNLLRAAGWTAVLVAVVAAYAISPVGFAGTVLILGSAAALTPTVREPLRQGWPGWKPSPATVARAERAGRTVRDTARPLAARAVDAVGDRTWRGRRPTVVARVAAAPPVDRREPAAVPPARTGSTGPHRHSVDPDTIIRQSAQVAQLRLQVVREQIAADAEQALAASADQQQRQAHLDRAAAHRAAAAQLLDRVHSLELDLTDLRAEPPACPDCGAWLGWHPSQCATCATVAAQSPPPAMNTHPAHHDLPEAPMTLDDFVPGPIPTPEEDPYQPGSDLAPPALGDVVTVELTDGTFATGTVTRSGPGRSFRFIDSDGVERLAHASDIRPRLPANPPPAGDDVDIDWEVALERLVAEIEAAGEPGVGWPASQDTGRYALDFNSDVFGNPYLASTRYLPSKQAATGYADLVLPRLRALENQVRQRLHPDDQDGADWPAYVTVVSERRDPAQGEDGDPVYEQDYSPATAASAAPASAPTEENAPMSSATSTSTSTTTGSELGTAGRASIQGLIVDWESSVEARQHPETFVAWLQAQAAAARQRAQMVPELVASYHGRGPSGHAGVPDSQITAFSAAYEESAMAEAEAYGRWAIEYAAYVEAAEEEMVSTYGREVIGSAHAAHNG